MSAIALQLRMMDSELWTYSLVSLLLAHIVADFAVRGELLNTGGKNPTKRLEYHLLAYTAVAFGLLVLNARLRGDCLLLIKLALGGALTHCLLDIAFDHTSIWHSPVRSRQRWLFIVQQGTKLFMLVGLATLGTFCFLRATSSWHFRPSDWHSMQALSYLLGYVFALCVGDAFVSFVLTKLEWSPPSGQEGVPGAGRIIGIFEALLVTTFIISYQYSAIGLALTAKSVARYEWLKDQKKTEYFLIGTLSNLVIAMIGGLLALWLSGQRLFPR